MLFEVGRRSKYRIVEFSSSFLIEALDRIPVLVELRPTQFLVWSDGKHEVCGLIEFRRLVDLVCNLLMKEWSPPDNRPGWPGIKAWAIGKTRQAVSKSLYGQWQRLIGKVDHRVISVQRAVFAATFGVAEITYNEHLYHDRFLVQDLVRYRAAAAAAMHIEELESRLFRNRLLNSCVAELTDLQNRLHSRSRIQLGLPAAVREPSLELLGQWLDLFSPSGSYTSLNKTLMNLPGRIPSSLLLNLTDFYLPRPVLRRLELLLILHYQQQPTRTNQNVVFHAPEKSVREAMRLVSSTIERRLTSRLTSDIALFVDFLSEFPYKHKGNIVGLARKWIRWKRDVARKDRERAQLEFGRDAQLGRPPIPLPVDPHVRFLGTPLDMVCEGQEMHHCVANFIEDALHAEAFFFHVDSEDEQATIQVDKCGSVVQAKGPWNQENRASKLGKQTLNHWGARFKSVRTPRRKSDCDTVSRMCDEEVPF